MSAPSNIYVLSGLGADKRVFDRIDWRNLNIHHVDWIEPLAHESIAAYAQRIATSITAKAPILIGLSFGGMIAIEIAKLLKVKKVIIISSVKTHKELAGWQKMIGKTKLTSLLPNNLVNKQNVVLNRLFGVHTSEDTALLKEILRDTDPHFLKWALQEIFNWNNETIPRNLIHIHGDQDKIMPFKNLEADYSIPGGGHFMIYQKASEISAILWDECRN